MNKPNVSDQIRIASPCSARWDDMAGTDRARFCGQCQKHVFNLSALTRAEIDTLIREKEGQFCGRFYQRPDGRMLTADCSVGGRLRRSRVGRRIGAILASSLLFLGLRSTVRSQGTNIMGKYASSNTNHMTLPVIQTNKPQPTMGAIAFPIQTVGEVSVAQPILPKKTNSGATPLIKQMK